MHDVAPGFVQRLVPDAGGIGPNLSPKAFASFPDRFRLVLQDSFAVLRLDQVHLMDQRKDVGMRREFLERFDYRVVGGEIAKVLPIPAVELTGLHVEDVDENPDLGEHIWLLGGEVIFREGVLALFNDQ